MAETGGAIAIKLSSNVILGKIDTGFTFNTDDIETSDADIEKESEYNQGRIHRELTGEFNLETSGTNAFGDIWDAHDGGSLLPFIYGGTDSGDLVFVGNCYIRDVEDDDPDNDRSTVVLNLRVTGDVTKTTVGGGIGSLIIPFTVS